MFIKATIQLYGFVLCGLILSESTLIMGLCECEQPEPVYMSVVFTKTLYGTDEPQKVPFNKILTEYPTGIWNNNTKDFICPKAGTYMFTFAVRPDQEHQASVHLMRGPNEVVVSIFANNNDHHAGTSCQSAILNLTLDERVWVRLDDGANMGIRSHPKSPSTTFNAFLINTAKENNQN